MKAKQVLAGMLAAVLLTSVSVPTLAVPATREQVRDRLLEAADDYNPGLTPEDILQGDPDGDLREGDTVTRAEALVMLSRAFGTLPEPVGHNARVAYPADHFTDVPDWAETALAPVLSAGLVAGTSRTTLSPQSPVTMEQLELLIDRAYALFGTNEKDDFYAAVNKTWLDRSVIRPGTLASGVFRDRIQDNTELIALVEQAVAHPQGEGQQRIATLYENILDWEARDAAGLTPLKPYLTALDAVDSLDGFVALLSRLHEELGVALLLGFGLEIDPMDSRYYMVSFSTLQPALGKTMYDEATAQQKEAYLTYFTGLLMLGGQGQTEARAGAERLWAIESALAPAMLDVQDYTDVDKTYHPCTLDDLQAWFPQVDLQNIYADTGFARTDRMNVMDVGLTRAIAAYFTPAHLDDLKLLLRVSLLDVFGGMLSRDFGQLAADFEREFYGIEGGVSEQELAVETIKGYLNDDLGKLYVQECFSPEAKADVEDMVADLLSVYETRIRQLDWMSQTTKERAVEKLRAIRVMVGYPDEDGWLDLLSGVTLTPASEGGSYFSNVVQMAKAQQEGYAKLLTAPVNKEVWIMAPYTVNAGYMMSYNAIYFPAGILQAPMYDIEASREENLGAIGSIIAHEITHAFDDNGAKYDKNGNAADWWTAEDYAAFAERCQQVVTYYDGVEAIPGVACDGALTLSENVADLGAIACIVDAAGQEPDADYKTLFYSVARIWASTTTREVASYWAEADVHAPDKLRGLLPLQAQEKFYETFGITETDGMWISPGERVEVW